MEEFFIKGKPLSECTTEELSTEWNAGMFLATQEDLSEKSLQRLLAVEAELTTRTDFPEEE